MPLHFIFKRLDRESFPQAQISTVREVFKEVSQKQVFFIDEGLFPQKV